MNSMGRLLAVCLPVIRPEASLFSGFNELLPGASTRPNSSLNPGHITHLRGGVESTPAALFSDDAPET